MTYKRAKFPPSDGATAQELSQAEHNAFKALCFAAKDPVAAVLDFTGTEDWTRRQMEHVGDAVVALVARQMCHELLGANQYLYFRLSQRFSSNANLPRGSISEVEIGVIYVRDGLAKACEFCKEMLQMTPAYEMLLRCADVARMSEVEKERLEKIVDGENYEDTKKSGSTPH